MSLLFTAAPQVDWLARWIAVGGLVIAGLSMLLARAAYRRGGYKVTVKVTAHLTDIPVDGTHIYRRTYAEIAVSNHRMGKVQLVHFHAQERGSDTVQVAMTQGPELNHTLDGIAQETWVVGHGQKLEVPASPAASKEIRLGVELANGNIIWSAWVKADGADIAQWEAK
ncbi:hypothetical protein ACIBHY_17045 [Nonomuraea sp. NPDC050547]|uniref:hypothetical protein n=1 Tax=Nonomuraea sp. NPDC050547 TaxID=3364368 RepID=UPI003799B526